MSDSGSPHAEDTSSAAGLESIAQLTDTTQLIQAVQFNEAGLVPAIAQDVHSGEVLMMAWMNAEALTATLTTGRGTYWSRSREQLWVKGETSGHLQQVEDVSVDCDGDTILLSVVQTGPACHTGTTSCFTGRSLLTGGVVPHIGAADKAGS